MPPLAYVFWAVMVVWLILIAVGMIPADADAPGRKSRIVLPGFKTVILFTLFFLLGLAEFGNPFK